MHNSFACLDRAEVDPLVSRERLQNRSWKIPETKRSAFGPSQSTHRFLRWRGLTGCRLCYEYAKPRENPYRSGSQFWRVRRGESSFDTYCASKGIKHVLEESVNPPRRARLNDGSEPTTRNTPDTNSTGNSSNTTTGNAHTWR